MCEMDPPVMMNGGDFGSGNTASSLCNLAEIWQYPINFGGGGNAASFTLGQLAGNNDNNNSGGSSTNAYMNNGDHVSVDDPMDLEQRGNNFQSKKRREEDDSSKGISTSSPSNGNVMQNDSDGKCLKMLGPKNESSELKTAADGSSAKRVENSAKLSEPLKQDYIHVRARRGQATDSHSLAERARREKISERMKILQDLVPGCNKVIGKALVLDEIINYIQALQQQVEFLSMKLEAVTSRSNPNPEGFPSKDFGQQTFDMTSMPFVSQPTREFSKGSSPEWLHMQIGGSFERTT